MSENVMFVDIPGRLRLPPMIHKAKYTRDINRLHKKAWLTANYMKNTTTKLYIGLQICILHARNVNLFSRRYTAYSRSATKAL